MTLNLDPSIHSSGFKEELKSVMASEDNYLDKIYVDQLLDFLDVKSRETIVLWSQGYKPYEIAHIIADKYGTRLFKPNTIALRISKILKKLHQISLEHT